MDMERQPWMEDSIEEARRDGARLRILYSQSPLAFSFPVLAGLVLVPMLWDRSSRVLLLGWLATVIVYSGLRLFFLLRCRHSEPEITRCGQRLNSFAVSALVSGIIWGAAPILLVPYQAGKLVEFTLHNGLVILVVCGLTAGAAVAYAASLRVLFLYVVPALVPPAFYLISLGDRYNTTLGGLVLLYFIFISAAAIRMNCQLQRYFETEFKLERLQKDLGLN